MDNKFTKTMSIQDGAIGFSYSNSSSPTLMIDLGYYACDGHRWLLSKKDAQAIREMVEEFLRETNDLEVGEYWESFKGVEDTKVKEFLDTDISNPVDSTSTPSINCVITPHHYSKNLLSGAIEEMSPQMKDLVSHRGFEIKYVDEK